MASSLIDVCRFNPTLGGTTDWTYSSAVTGYQSPTAAGAVNGATYSYRAESADLTQWEIGTGGYNSGTGVFARTAVLFNSAGTTAKINFSAVPQVAIVALAEDLPVRTAASQADQETATSNSVAVTPGVQHHHPSAAKAWVRFNASTGTPTIVSSYNVSSLTDNGVGDTTINFTTAFSSNLYSWIATCDLSSTAQSTGRWVQLVSPSPGSLRILTCSTASATGEDMEFVNVLVFGDL